MEHEAQVLVDGKDLPLAPFVEKLVAQTVSALIGSLKGGEGAKEITVVVRAKKAPAAV